MRRPWFAARPVDDPRFFDEAPVRLVGRFAIPRPAASVWADLSGEDTLGWCRILDRITWTSPRPLGVGATREVSALKGAIGFQERYFVWEEGRRKAFTVERATAPLANAFAEDYLVEPGPGGADGPDGAASCVFTWTIAYEPSLAGRAGEPVNRRLLSSLFRDTRRHYGAAWLR